MSNLLNLSKAYGNKFNLLNTIKGLNLNVLKWNLERMLALF